LSSGNGLQRHDSTNDRFCGGKLVHLNTPCEAEMPNFDPSTTIIGADFRPWRLLVQNHAGVYIIAGRTDKGLPASGAAQRRQWKLKTEIIACA